MSFRTTCEFYICNDALLVAKSRFQVAKSRFQVAKSRFQVAKSRLLVAKSRLRWKEELEWNRGAINSGSGR